MSAGSLLDTNIVVYLLDSSHPGKYQRAGSLVESGIRNGDCCISQQVVNEALNVATGKLGYSEARAADLLEATLLPLCRTVDPSPLYRRGLEVRFRYKYSFYDSMVIAAALELDCRTLYSEDLQHGQKIGQLTIANPFR